VKPILTAHHKSTMRVRGITAGPGPDSKSSSEKFQTCGGTIKGGGGWAFATPAGVVGPRSVGRN
jgi:hypothetical protein